MSVDEYSLKFTLLFKYAPSLVSNLKDEMSRLVTGVSDLVKEECRMAMLHDDMNISILVVYAQFIEESKLERNNMKMKRPRSDEQSQPRSKKRSICAKCGKQNLGKCLADTDGCFGCGKKGHKMRDFPTHLAKGRDTKQASLNGPDLDAPKWNRFYTLQANKDNGANPDEGTGK
ncbi:uncharacterized protein LOC125836823 [Solanum verrucosum]|uniref:uncharacterized protein LOC125836823 n=1 Tax=Solanum verrucosum TaxID=315347 RepID=UPI0020D19CD2|nr:uncharacterized protein LOC125836823 [Solanum verrucosum]